MEHLCSAYLGRKIKRTVQIEKKCKSEEEIYGFLPWQTIRLVKRRETFKQQLENKTMTTEDTPKSQRHNISSATSADIMNIFCKVSPLTSDTPLQDSPEPSTDLQLHLANANELQPANIPMLITEDHFASLKWISNKEVSVCKGMVVNALYKRSEWLYVRTPNDNTGFVPYTCVKPLFLETGSGKDFAQQFPERSPPLNGSLSSSDRSRTDSSDVSFFSDSRDSRESSHDDNVFNDSGHYDSSLQNSTCLNLSQSFLQVKDLAPRIRSPICSASPPQSSRSSQNSHKTSQNSHKTVANTDKKLTIIFDYNKRGTNDVSVKHQDIVISSFEECGDWVWVKKSNGQEGYIPKSYTANLELLNLDPSTRTTYL